jgi:hypothetical protein
MTKEKDRSLINIRQQKPDRSTGTDCQIESRLIKFSTAAERAGGTKIREKLGITPATASSISDFLTDAPERYDVIPSPALWRQCSPDCRVHQGQCLREIGLSSQPAPAWWVSLLV